MSVVFFFPFLFFPPSAVTCLPKHFRGLESSFLEFKDPVVRNVSVVPSALLFG